MTTLVYALTSNNEEADVVGFYENLLGLQGVHPKGDQSWVFLGRTDAEDKTPILWPTHVKC